MSLFDSQEDEDETLEGLEGTDFGRCAKHAFDTGTFLLMCRYGDTPDLSGMLEVSRGPGHTLLHFDKAGKLTSAEYL
jgi:hypothetical protein